YRGFLDTAYWSLCFRGFLWSVGTDTPYLLDGYGILRQWSFNSSKSWIRRIGLGQSAKKRWIQELNRKHKVNFMSIQETKMENINLFSINALLGKFSFDYASTPSIGYSGGTWVSTSTKLLIISVYAPQDVSKWRTLWQYISIMIDSWEGANAINYFILMAGLVDLPLEGYSYTWSHKLASKMSKLDRFLISKGFLLVFPSLSAICLDGHLMRSL
ncbi:RNA-directed DNA polymerase, eukaryota, partial [Tanacetum coccineum]